MTGRIRCPNARRRNVRKKLFIGALIGVIAAVGFAAPAQASPTWLHYVDAKVSVFHGVPNTPVNVFVNHKEVLANFQPGSFAGPLSLKPGQYTVSITAASATDDTHPVIGPVTLTFLPRGNYTIAAHLTAAGAPTATLFKNTLFPVKHGDGRVIVRHIAAAPAVDILVNGNPTMRGLTNPHQSIAILPSATYAFAVALAGTTAPVIGPANVPVPRGKDTIVYAWGSATGGTLAVAVQTVPLRW